MKHIRIFEEYTEEELRGLQDTLHDVGHKSKFVFGEDFGFGGDFKSKDWKIHFPGMSGEMTDILLNRGEIYKLKPGVANIFSFKTPEKFGFKKDKVNPRPPEIRQNSFGNYIISYDVQNLNSFNEIVKKLSEIRI